MNPFFAIQGLLWLMAVLCLGGCSDASSDGGSDATIEADRVAVDDLVSALDRVAVEVPIVDVTRVDVGVDAGNATDITLVDGPRDVVAPFAFPVDPTAVPPPGSECASADAGMRPGDPSIDPPRPVIPQSVSRVTSQRPTFRWILPAGTTGAHVEACADRCCTRVLGSYDAEGTSVRPERAFPPGMVYWRMFGHRGGSVGTRASATWEFEVRRRDTPVDSSWGTIRDFNGDGYDDLVELVTPRGTTSQIMFVAGGATGPAAARNTGEFVGAPANWTEIGDFNGDGRADIVFATRDTRSDNPIQVLQGAPDGVHPALALNVSAVPCAHIENPTIADWNGDGYSDVVASIKFGCGETSFDVLASRLALWSGSPSGLARVPQMIWTLSRLESLPYQAAIHGMGDADRDGFGDILLDAERIGHEIRTFLVGGDLGGVPHVTELSLPPGEFSDGLKAGPVGDFDGDGLADFAVRPFVRDELAVYRTTPGTLFGPVPTIMLRDEIFSNAAWMVHNPGGIRSGFGYVFDSADMNGDGYADLLVASPGSFSMAFNDFMGFNEGRVFIYRGSASGLVPDPLWIGRVPPTDGTNPYEFANDVVGPGDINGDGVDDVAVFDFGLHSVCVVFGENVLRTGNATNCLSVGADAGANLP